MRNFTVRFYSETTGRKVDEKKIPAKDQADADAQAEKLTPADCTCQVEEILLPSTTKKTSHFRPRVVRY